MKTVNIAGQTFRVRRVSDVNAELRRLGIEEPVPLVGIMNPGKKPEILIRKGTPKDEASILLHEMIHAADNALSEARVEDLEDALAPILWRQGWRPFGGK